MYDTKHRQNKDYTSKSLFFFSFICNTKLHINWSCTVLYKGQWLKDGGRIGVTCMTAYIIHKRNYERKQLVSFKSNILIKIIRIVNNYALPTCIRQKEHSVERTYLRKGALDRPPM
jgi:hypothetical protein